MFFLTIKRKSISAKLEKIKHSGTKIRTKEDYVSIAKDFDSSYNNYLAKTRNYKGWVRSFFPSTHEFKARKVCAERTQTINNFINNCMN